MPQSFVINTPGWDDIIKIRPDSSLPIAEQMAKKREQAIALSQSPVPQVLQGLTQYISMLDDTEDILSTALLLARPLLRRLPARLIPGLGWILLAKDALDLGTYLLSLALTGPTGKRGIIEQVKALSFKRGNRIRKATDFFNKVPGLGAILEGLQATETIFGVGLCLGPVMGMISDHIWGGIRGAMGHRVKVQAWTEPNIVNDAAKLLYQAPNLLNGVWSFPPETQIKVYAAIQIAQDILTNAMTAELPIQRFELVKNTPPPQLLPTNEMSIQALGEIGIQWDRDEPVIGPEMGGTPPPLETWITSNVPQGEQEARLQQATWGSGYEATFMTMGALEIADRAITWIESDTAEDVWAPNMSDMIIKSFAEFGYTFWPETPDITKASLMLMIGEAAMKERYYFFVNPADPKHLLYGDLGWPTTAKPYPRVIKKAFYRCGARKFGFPRLPPHEPPQPWTDPGWECHAHAQELLTGF